MTQTPRAEGFQRIAPQEELLEEVNRLLGTAEEAATAGQPSTPQLPMLFIVGAPRSGTTLFLQWLAASKEFGYPSNLIARFFRAPYTGALIQRLLTDPELDYRNELVDARGYGDAWSSEVGKTRGMLQPHEFFYFWRRFFPIDQAQKLSEDALAKADPAGFAAGWASLERALKKPLAAKGILLQYDIDRLAEWLPRAIFIHTKRDVFFNVQSLLEARVKVTGSRDAWFSVQPPEYEWLQHEDGYTQVAGQVIFSNRAIASALARLPNTRSVLVEYEDFCTHPAATWDRLREAMSAFDYDLPQYEGPASFSATNAIRCDAAEADLIRSVYQKLLEMIEDERGTSPPRFPTELPPAQA